MSLNITAIRTIKPPEVEITDHGLVRYLERVHGLDMDVVRKGILTEKQEEMGLFGDCRIKAGNGRQYVIKNRKLVTVI